MNTFHRLVCLVPFAVLASIPQCSPSTAHAAPVFPSQPLLPSLEIEVTDVDADRRARAAHFSLPVLEGTSASLIAEDGTAKYNISVTAQTPDKQLRLKLNRSDRSPAADIQLDAAMPIRAGSRLVLGKIKREDGRDTEVAAIVH